MFLETLRNRRRLLMLRNKSLNRPLNRRLMTVYRNFPALSVICVRPGPMRSNAVGERNANRRGSATVTAFGRNTTRKLWNPIWKRWRNGKPERRVPNRNGWSNPCREKRLKIIFPAHFPAVMTGNDRQGVEGQETKKSENP